MGKVLNLRFPVAGINRRLEFSNFSSMRSAFPTPWAVNVRPVDPLELRRRGGSRPGLTKYLDHNFGTTITSIAEVPSASESGVAKYLAVVADNYLGVIENGSLSAPVPYLVSETGDHITDEGGNRITLSTANVPANCFLVVRDGKIYGITTTAVYVLNPEDGQVTTITASEGAVPTGCTFGAVYRDRLVLAGGDNAIYLSRQGDFEDWGYNADSEDTGRATAIQLSEAGEIGEQVTALIPHGDATLLASTSRGLWVIQGDPCDTGSLKCVSRDIGIIDPNAWCKIDGSIAFLSRNGLYSVSANGGNLTPLSDDRLPSELQNIDTATTTVRVAHQCDEDGLHLFLTPSSGVGQHWFFDLKEQGFWLDAMQADHQPTAVCEIDGNVVLACKDGYLRSLGGSSDDGTAIQSHVLIGPLRLASEPKFGMIMNIHGVTGRGSGAVTWRLVTGETADEAAWNAKAAIEAYQTGGSYASYVKASGLWSGGRTKFSYPRTRAMWAVVWLQSAAPWAYESVVMETKALGRWR